jgi:hypothetical protein
MTKTHSSSRSPYSKAEGRALDARSPHSAQLRARVGGLIWATPAAEVTSEDDEPDEGAAGLLLRV